MVLSPVLSCCPARATWSTPYTGRWASGSTTLWYTYPLHHCAFAKTLSQGPRLILSVFPFCKRLSIYEIFLNSTAPAVESSALSSLISCVTIGAILVVFILKLKQFPPEVMGMDFGMFNFHA